MNMIKNILLVVLLLSFAAVVSANEENSIAPKSAVDEAIALCTGYATEDNVAADELKVYMLDCVNTELEDNGYQKLDKLPG